MSLSREERKYNDHSKEMDAIMRSSRPTKTGFGHGTDRQGGALKNRKNERRDFKGRVA